MIRCANVLYILLNFSASRAPEIDEREDDGIISPFGSLGVVAPVPAEEGIVKGVVGHLGSLGVVAPVPAEDGIVEGVLNPFGSEGVLAPASA